MPLRMRRRGAGELGETSTGYGGEDDDTLLPLVSNDGDEGSNNKEEKRYLYRWLTSQWRKGDLRDKAFLVLLIFLILVTIFGGIPYYYFFCGVCAKTTILNISAGDGNHRPTTTTTTIHIPMEEIPQGEGPTLTLFRPFLESSFWSPQRHRLRQTGEQALVQLGDQLRQLMVLGNDLFQPPSALLPKSAATQEEDDEKIQKFQQQIKEMAPWLKGYPNNNNNQHHQSQDKEEEEEKGDVTTTTTTIWPINQVPSPYSKSKMAAGDNNNNNNNINNKASMTTTNYDKAVVICAGDKQLTYLDSLLYTIRNIHQSTIPIRIVYRGDDDLSLQSRQLLTKKFATTKGGDEAEEDLLLRFIDLTDVFDLNGGDNDPHHLRSLKGWNLKPFGMLAVPESQVILLDVDVLLLRPPEDFFELNEYKIQGALFFRDRSGKEHLWTPRQFVVSMVQQQQQQPNAISQLAQKALTNGNIINEHIQEAGVVMIDKSRRWKGLWTICLILGRWDIRRFLQRDIIYGDKEVYFTAFETINEPYAFARYYPGVLGSVLSDFHGDELEWKVDTLPPSPSSSLGGGNSDDKTKKEIYQLGPYMALCGRMLHFDDQGLPLWSNGGYLTREDDRNANDSIASRGLKPLLFVDGGDSTSEEGPNGIEGNQNWRFHHGLGVLCLFPNKRKIQKVPLQYAEKGGEAVDYYIKSSNTGIK